MKFRFPLLLGVASLMPSLTLAQTQQPDVVDQMRRYTNGEAAITWVGSSGFATSEDTTANSVQFVAMLNDENASNGNDTFALFERPQQLTLLRGSFSKFKRGHKLTAQIIREQCGCYHVTQYEDGQEAHPWWEKLVGPDVATQQEAILRAARLLHLKPFAKTL